MNFLLSNITRLSTAKGLLIRFNVTVVVPAEPEELRFTFKGCLLGRGTAGLWVMPSTVQKQGWSWTPGEWSQSVSKRLLDYFETTRDKNLKRAVRELGSTKKPALVTEEFKDLKFTL